MFVTTEKPAVGNRAAHVVARIVLSSGAGHSRML